ncbi:SDR family NAD(P)-dependent oxidoreductase [Actinacidiphila yeochonensis]|uniref:SDR family NAD(P)-dependent oxidoreductase n=1 Tax=Actinacidiphila yeochonensis TaxID=89050 RepID=UPI0005674B8D|nr:SDR family oxidoreductase [Actinacidiphila yeochonensis]
MDQLTGSRALVVGASRGLGRGVTEAFLAAGAEVVALSRDVGPLGELASVQPRLRLERGDAADPVLAGSLLDRYRPDVLAILAGASPLLRPITRQTWETFSTSWDVDVRIAFTWVRESLLLPLEPGSRVIVTSSGAALRGSPLSGGYAGAKSAVRFLAEYAAQEADRDGLGITVSSVLPQLTPATGLGRAAVDAYARRAGVSVEEFVDGMGPTLTPEAAGAAFLSLAVAGPEQAGAHLLTGAGLRPLD